VLGALLEHTSHIVGNLRDLNERDGRTLAEVGRSAIYRPRER